MSFIIQQKRNVGVENYPQLRLHLDQTFDEALQSVFSLLPYADLRKCMIISKLWRKIALEELQARFFVKLSREEHVKLVLQQLHDHPNFRIGKCNIVSVITPPTILLDNMLLDHMFHKVRHTLHFLKLETAIGINEITLFKLLEKLPNLTHLSITSITTRENTTTASDVYEESHRKFPFLSGRKYTSANSNNPQEVPEEWNTTLEKLTIKEKENGYDAGKSFSYESILHLHLDLGQYISLQLSKIFQVFPNLVELAVTNISDEPRKNFKSSAPPPHHYQWPYQRKLKHLAVRQYSSHGYSEKLMQTLIRLNMSLESLVLILHPPKLIQPCSPLLKQFIESSQETLQSLKLIQVEDDVQHSYCHRFMSSSSDAEGEVTSMPEPAANYFFWNFNYSSHAIPILPVSLPRLRILHVQKPIITNLAQVIHHYPALQELSLQVSCGSNWKCMLPTRLEPHQGIISLKIDFIDSESFMRLGYCFPALQTLQLAYCDKKLFDVLCDLIPYFNGGGNLASCQTCHGTSEEFTTEKQNSNSEMPVMEVPQSAYSDDLHFSPACYNDNKDRIGFTNNPSKNSLCGTTSEEMSRKKHRFKRLANLCVRPCEHFPYEKFVFLRSESPVSKAHEETKAYASNKVRFGGSLGGNSEGTGFTWIEAEVREEFYEFSVNPAEAESCSSA